MGDKLEAEIENIKLRKKHTEEQLNKYKKKREKLINEGKYEDEYEWMISRYSGMADELHWVINRLERLIVT